MLALDALQENRGGMVDESDEEISKIRARSHLHFLGWVETDFKSIG